VEKKFIERDDKPNHTEYLIIKTGHADLHLRTTASLNTQIKLAEDLGWSKYNSERSWTVLDKLFRLAQSGGQAPGSGGPALAVTALPILIALSRRSSMTMPESQQQNLPEAEECNHDKEVRQPQTEPGYAP
jgi:hypothetical protein